jgi:putative ABC transport system ATP-binding protein
MGILKLDHVGYRYSDANQDDYVIKDISYDFDLGKVYAINGKSGSGKTTLLSLLSGLERCTLGNIYYDNNNLNKMDLDKYRSTCIGIVFQSYNLLPHLNALENVILSMDIGHLDIKDKNELAMNLLNSVGISEEKAKRRVLKLSGGEQQRVAIARSLSYNPKIILADEPTGNLDQETEKDILKIFKDLAHKENKCVIIVTHSKNVTNEADEVMLLDKKK